MTWHDDDRWQARFEGELLRLLEPFRHQLIDIAAPVVFQRADASLDRNRVSDFTLSGGRAGLAFRIRKFAAYQEYRDQFTLRADRPSSNMRTEIEKVLDGEGDLLIYGFSDEAEERLALVYVLDLRRFRSWHRSELLRTKTEPGAIRETAKDGVKFRVFNVNEINQQRPGFLVATIPGMSKRMPAA